MGCDRCMHGRWSENLMDLFDLEYELPGVERFLELCTLGP